MTPNIAVNTDARERGELERECHPLFRVCQGHIESWERQHGDA